MHDEHDLNCDAISPTLMPSTMCGLPRLSFAAVACVRAFSTALKFRLPQYVACYNACTRHCLAVRDTAASTCAKVVPIMSAGNEHEINFEAPAVEINRSTNKRFTTRQEACTVFVNHLLNGYISRVATLTSSSNVLWSQYLLTLIPAMQTNRVVQTLSITNRLHGSNYHLSSRRSFQIQESPKLLGAHNVLSPILMKPRQRLRERKHYTRQR